MEESSENFFQRQGKAFCSCCFGIILVPIVMGFVFWNENNEVVEYATANLVNKATPVTGCLPISGGSDKLIFAPCSLKFTADPTTQAGFSALQEFLPAYEGYSISWQTEIYGWQQESHSKTTKDNHGGTHTVTTYTCSQGWQSSLSQENFKCPQFVGRNPNNGFAIREELKSRTVAVGGNTVQMKPSAASTQAPLALTDNLANQLPSEDLFSKLKQKPCSGSGLCTSGGYVATGAGGLGTNRLKLTGQTATSVTVAAEQGSSAGSYVPFGAHPAETFGWFGKKTKPLEKLEPGILTKDAFIKLWNSEIAAQAWLIRFVTFIVMVIAFEMIVQPLSVSADLLRMLNWCTCCIGTLLDNVAQCVIHTIAFFCAMILWLFTFAIAWIVARPVLGICMLLADIAIVAGCVYLKKQREKGARQVDPSLLTNPERGMGGYPVAATQSQMSQPPMPQQYMSQPPVAQAQPGTMTMNVTCPQGVGPGGLVGIMTQSGQQVNVTVPQGVYPGQHFNVQVPA